MLSLALNALLQFVYPPLCCRCQNMGSFLCQDCSMLINVQIFPLNIPENSALDSMTVAFTHTPPISDLITTMKYQSVIGVAHFLGELLYLHTNFPQANVVTSVPLTSEKQR